MKSRITVLTLLTLWAMQVSATTWYVSAGGSGAGTSWADAAAGTQLQTIINGTLPGDEVWVMAGTYFPTVGGGRSATFTMRPGVKIYGSFAGGETMVAQRPFSNGPTSILSGAIGTPSFADNAFHVVSNGNGLDTTAYLDGFVVRDGNDDRSPNVANNGLGGGIFNNGGGGGVFCSPQIRNCVITNNFAQFGGGIFNSGQSGGNASPYILNCVIMENGAYIGGGGIDNFGLAGTASPGIVNTLVVSNVAGGRAGGMYCWGGNNGNASPSVLNSVFANNVAMDTFPALPDGFDGGGGGIVADRVNSPPGSFSGNANPVFRNTIFWGNTTPGTGPQFELLGGATFVATFSDVDLTGQVAPHVISGPGTGNLASDPLFVDEGNAGGIDGNLFTSDDGYILQDISPCVNVGENAGVTAADIRGHVRIAGSVVEMGAYESNSMLLPVSLLHFQGEAVGADNVLNWTVGHPSEGIGIVLERSNGGRDFEALGVAVEGMWSVDGLSFRFVDDRVVAVRHCYRLKLRDQNGNWSYSETVIVQNDRLHGLTVFPNPTRGRLHYRGGNGEPVQVDVMALDGQLLVQADVLRGDVLDLAGLASGVYLLRLTQSGRSVVQRIVKD